jgi:hypothetical protein
MVEDNILTNKLSLQPVKLTISYPEPPVKLLDPPQRLRETF